MGYKMNLTLNRAGIATPFVATNVPHRRFLTILLMLVFLITACRDNQIEVPDFKDYNTGPYFLKLEHLDFIYMNREDPLIQNEIDQIVSDAENQLNSEFSFVTDKIHLPASGDKHDYMSVAPMLWPDSTGIYTIQRDCCRNPILYEYDRPKLADVSYGVYTLALAYYFVKDERYAEKASDLLYNWFLNESTRMNPNLNYAQVALGVDDNKERHPGQGIIDTNDFIRMIEAVSLIYGSHYWTSARHIELKKWFYHYSLWILDNYNSNYSCSEEWCNNISTWFDAQKTIYFLFSEQEDRLNSSSSIQPIREKILLQFSDFGIQAFERQRTRSQHYVYFNLRAFVKIANMRKKRGGFDRDWKVFNSPDYGGIKPALDAIVAYLNGDDSNDFFEISPDFDNCRYLEILRPAAVVFESSEYEEASQQLIQNGCRNPLILLTFPDFQRLQL